MSCVGATTGLPSAGESRLAVESIIVRASSWAAVESGTWTAIWWPSKSALNAVETRGWIWMAEPSTRTGMNAWMPRRWSVGARLSRTGWSLMTSSRTSQTSGRTRSTMRLALLMLWAKPFSTSWRMTNGLNSSRALFLGRADWWGLGFGPTAMNEPPLLALEHVAERLQAMVAGAGDRPAPATVVDEGVARLLEHPLLVADDDLRRTQLEQSLEPVVPVDHAAVEVVEVGGREAAAIELDHRPEVRRDDRQDRQDHPVGTRA